MRRFGFGLCLLLVIAAFSTASAEQPSYNQQDDLASSLATASQPYSIAAYRTFSPFGQGEPRNDSRDFMLDWPQVVANLPKPRVEKIKRTTINPSMVGYIDDAGVHSQVRVRFDAALDDETPDRAEFFYAKCGCYAFVPPANGAYDPNTPGPGPGVPKDVNFQQLYFYGEYAPTPHISFFAQLPLRWLQPQSPPGAAQAFPSSSGLGDIQIGLKFAPLVSSRHSLTLQFRSYLPSGDAHSGLGTNHASIEPSLLYYQQLSEKLAIEAELGDTHPLSSSAGVPTVSSKGFAGDVFFYGAGPSYQLVQAEQFHLAAVVELVGWNVRSGYVTGPANPSTAGVNIVNLKVGPRVSGIHHSFYAGYGIALTSQNWYREIFRTEYRYTF
jgi:hypothetical protein